MRYPLLLRTVALGLSLLAATQASAGQPEEDEATLKEAGVGTDTPALLKFFRKHVLSEKEHARVRTLLRKLSDDSFQVREKASADLLALGPGAAPLLREGARSSDPEVAYRSKECLAVVLKGSTPSVLSAAIRLLVHRKPPEAAEALLAFAPVADTEEVLENLRAALVKLARRQGKTEPALTAALEDRLPARRALAAEALIRCGALEGAAARKCLADDSALVRFRTALALVEQADRAAVPVLIDVLPDVSLQQAWAAEDVLCRLAGERRPEAVLGPGEASRKSARDAWRRWWRQHGAAVDLARLKEKPPFLGLTLVAFQDFQGQGQLMELGRDGRARWQFGGLAYPIDLQVIGDGRFLVAEMNGHRVTERNRKGEVVWQKQVTQPVACQRLAGGNTLIATPNGVLEVDARGKQVFSYNRGRWDILGARKHPNGEYVLLTRMQLVRIDARGKEVKSFSVGRSYNYTSFQVLPNGNLLLPSSRSREVAEYTLDGRKVWSARVGYPTSAQRLPNGNTLVTSMNYRRLIELDRNGREVSQTQVPGTPWCAVRR